MRIAYCTNVRLPSERAHGHQIAQVCDALINLGHEVTVFATIRKETVEQPFASYYGVSGKIGLRHIGYKRLLPNWPPLRPLRLFLQNRGLLRDYRMHLKPENFDLLYTRAPALLPALLETGIPVILELHSLPRRNLRTFIRHCGQCRLVDCLTSSMHRTLKEWGVPEGKLMTEGDGVDLRRFAKVPPRDEARLEIGLHTDRLVVGYVGRLKTLFMEKGVKHILEAVKQLQHEKKFLALIVGGPEKDADEYRKMAKDLGLGDEDVRFTGEVSGKEVPKMLAACDVLAMPFPDFPHYRHHMSPLKMFEYMAADRPMISSDLPTVRDVLTEEVAYFCVPGDSADLAAVLSHIAAHPDEARAKAVAAAEKVKNHTWEERMKRVLRAASLPA